MSRDTNTSHPKWDDGPIGNFIGLVFAFTVLEAIIGVVGYFFVYVPIFG